VVTAAQNAQHRPCGGKICCRSSPPTFCLIVCVAYPLTLRWLRVGPEKPKNRRCGWCDTGKGILLAALIVYIVYLVLSWNQATSGLPGLGTQPRRAAQAPLASLLIRRWSCCVCPPGEPRHVHPGTLLFPRCLVLLSVLFVPKSRLAFLATAILLWPRRFSPDTASPKLPYSRRAVNYAGARYGGGLGDNCLWSWGIRISLWPG
jgi:hypothetical protein